MSNQVLEQLKQEYNETVKRLQDLGEVIANCEDIDARHCGQDGPPCDGNAVASLKNLLGMQVIGVGQGKCVGCPQDHYGTPCVKVELIGGAYICLAPTSNTITE